MSTKKFYIALKVKEKNYSALLTLGRVIVSGMTAEALSYPAPNPSLTTAASHLDMLESTIAAWGTVSNRGSHEDLLTLRAIRDVVRKDLFCLACYVANTTPNDAVRWTAAGFPLKSPMHKIGTLQAVQDLRQFISRTVLAGTIKLKWGKPLDTANIDINGYRVMRSVTGSYIDAVQVAIVTRTTFTDVNPADGMNRYWVTPFHTAGFGVESDMCVAAAGLLPS